MKLYAPDRYWRVCIAFSVLFHLCAMQKLSFCQTTQSTDIPIIRNESGPICAGPVFDLEPVRVIGRDSGIPEWQIFPRGAAVLTTGSDDRLYIGTSDHKIIITTTRGRMIGEFGGYGDGPGEFRGLSDLYWIENENEYWLNDSTLNRITKFSIDGELLSINSYHQHSEDWMYLIHLRNNQFLGFRIEYGDDESTQIYGLLDDELSWDREVLSVSNPRLTGNSYSPGSGIVVSVPYYSRGAWIESFPDGRFVLLQATEGCLTYYSQSGNPLFKVEDCFEFPAITKEDVEIFLKRVGSRRPEELPAARRVKFPDRMGAFWTALTDDSGRLWIQQQKYLYNDEGEPIGYHFYILDREGRLLGTQTFPFEARNIKIKGDLLFWSDQGGEEYGPRIRVFRLVPNYQ